METIIASPVGAREGPPSEDEEAQPLMLTQVQPASAREVRSRKVRRTGATAEDAARTFNQTWFAAHATWDSRSEDFLGTCAVTLEEEESQLFKPLLHLSGLRCDSNNGSRKHPMDGRVTRLEPTRAWGDWRAMKHWPHQIRALVVTDGVVLAAGSRAY